MHSLSLTNRHPPGTAVIALLVRARIYVFWNCYGILMSTQDMLILQD